jgi:hypothetical protein
MVYRFKGTLGYPWDTPGSNPWALGDGADAVKRAVCRATVIMPGFPQETVIRHGHGRAWLGNFGGLSQFTMKPWKTA